MTSRTRIPREGNMTRYHDRMRSRGRFAWLGAVLFVLVVLFLLSVGRPAPARTPAPLKAPDGLTGDGTPYEEPEVSPGYVDPGDPGSPPQASGRAPNDDRLEPRHEKGISGLLRLANHPRLIRLWMFTSVWP